MEALAGSLLGSNPTLTGAALIVVVLVIISLMTGQLVSKWTVKSLLAARDERVTQANLRAEDYKRLYETTNTALETVRGQVTELLVTAETTRRVVNAIPVPREGDSL